MASNGEFLIRVKTVFEQTGLNTIVQETQAALARVGRLPATQRDAASRGIISGAQERIGAAKAQALQGFAPGTADYRGVVKRFGDLRAALTTALRGIESGKINIKQLEQSFKDLPAEARKAGNAIKADVLKAAKDFNALGPGVRASVGAATGAARYRSADYQRLDRDAIKALGGIGRGFTATQDPKQSAADREFAQNQALAARGKAEEAAITQEAIAADTAYIRDTARASAARRSQATQTRAAELGVGTRAEGFSDDELRARSAVQERINADVQAARVARIRTTQETGLGQQSAAAQRLRIDAERDLARVEHAAARDQVRAAIAERQGTRFQRAQAKFQYRGPARLPEDYQTAGQFLGARALTTVGFAAAGTLLYGTVRAVGEVIRESEELDRILNQVEAQLVAVDDAGSLPQAREGILGIARATGAQADEIASVFFQFRGAFADVDGALTPTAEALKQTDSAMKVVAVTGLSLKEVLDSLTSVARTFDTDVEHIGDTALGLQERFGVLARETVTFVADLAPVAEQIGLSLEDTASLGAIVQRVSGRSGSAIAEGFGRVLPQLQEVRSEILQIYNLPQLKSKQIDIAEAFGRGETGVVLKALIRDFGLLDKQQQQFVTNLLGGRREAQLLSAIFGQASEATEEFARNASGLNNDVGKTDKYFQDLRETVQNTQARMVEAFKQIGTALFAAGLADGLVFAADSAAVLADALGLVFDILEKLNSIGAPLDNLIPGDIAVFDDLPGKLLLLGGAMTVANKTFAFFAKLLGTTAAAQAVETAASVTATGANQAEAVASAEVAAAKTAEALALQEAAAAGLVEGVASSAGAARNSAEAVSSLYSTPGRVGGLFTGGGAAAVTPLAGVALAAGAALVVHNKYQSTASSVQESEAAAIENLKTYSNARLREITEQTTGFWDRVAIRFFGSELPEELAAEQLVRNESAGPSQNITSLLANYEGKLVKILGDAVSTGPGTGSASEVLTAILEINKRRFGETQLDEILGFSTGDIAQSIDTGQALTAPGGEINADQIRALLKAAQEDGDALAAMALQKIDAFIQNNKELADLLGLSLSEDVENAAIEAAGGKAQRALQLLEDTRKQYEAGTVSTATYLAKLREAKAAADLQASTSTSPEDDALAADAERELNQALGDLRLKQIERLGTVTDLLSGGAGDDAERSNAVLDRQIASLNAFISGDEGTQEQRFDQLPVIIGLLRDTFERDLSNIADDTARARKEAQGFALPPEVEALLVESELVDSEQFSGAIERFATLAKISLGEAFQRIAKLAVDTKLTVEQIITQVLQEELDNLVALFRTRFAGSSPNQIEHSPDAGALSGRIAGLREELKGVPKGDVDRLTEGRGFAGGSDPQKAADDAAEAARDLARARLEFEAIRVSRDPVRSAQVAIQQAQLAISQAENTADRIRAEGDLLQAQRDLQSALVDVVFAQIEQAEAVAEIAGDSVGAAKARLDAANLKLLEVMQDPNSGDAERIAAQTGQLQAQAGVRDAGFRDRLDDLEFAREIGKVTTQQAISVLQEMLKIPEYTEDQRRELIRQINSLKDDLGADYQFNLPTDIGLPTLYEVRRLNQTPSGQGYNDNRVININFTANNTADAESIANTIVESFSRPTRFGTAPRPF